jgi:hypothetical protein
VVGRCGESEAGETLLRAVEDEEGSVRKGDHGGYYALGGLLYLC